MPPRILIAEDDDLQAAVLRTALEGRGYEAEIVSDGLQAVRRLRTRLYDLALLDYHLPEVDGLAAARLLHDFFADGERPRLIAVTATAEGLSEKEALNGTSFDAVVSKRLGLSVLLTTIDANLVSAAERHAGVVIARSRAAVRDAEAMRRRRILAPLAALPGLAMAAAFAWGIGWAVASLRQADATIGAADRAAALSTDTAALVGAVQDSETSERTYLGTRALVDRALFEADIQRLDQLLVSRAPVTASGTPGLGAGPPRTIIMPRLRILAAEVQLAQAAEGTPVPPASPVSAAQGRDVAVQLRAWAAALVIGSQQAVRSGLQAVRENIELVLACLAIGVVYGLSNALQSVRRCWRGRDTPDHGPPDHGRSGPLALRSAWSTVPLLNATASRHADKRAPSLSSEPHRATG